MKDVSQLRAMQLRPRRDASALPPRRSSKLRSRHSQPSRRVERELEWSARFQPLGWPSPRPLETRFSKVGSPVSIWILNVNGSQGETQD